VGEALLYASGEPRFPAADSSLHGFIQSRAEFPEDVRNRLIETLFERLAPSVQTVLAPPVSAASGELKVVARWEAGQATDGESWRELGQGKNALSAADGSVPRVGDHFQFGDAGSGAFHSDPLNCPLASARSFAVAVSFSPDDAGKVARDNGEFWASDQLVSADHSCHGDEWGFGYGDGKFYFGVGDSAGGVGTLTAAPAAGSMAQRWWTAVATWSAGSFENNSPLIALWLFDAKRELLASSGPADPNQLAGKSGFFE